VEGEENHYVTMYQKDFIGLTTKL